MNLSDLNLFVWPLVFVLVALVVLRKLGDDLRPVFVNVVGGVANNAKQHSLAYAMATILAVLSGLNALGDVAKEFQWQYVVAATKVLTPMLATVVAYLTKPPAFTQADTKTGNTVPPFQPSSPKP